MNENSQDAPEGDLVAKFDDIRGSYRGKDNPDWIWMVSYSISMPNLLTFVTEADENQIFIDAWLKKTIFESATFQLLAHNTDEGIVPWQTSEFRNVKIDNVTAGVTVSRHSHPCEGAHVSCIFETCCYRFERQFEGGSRRRARPDCIHWSNRDGKTRHHESRIYKNEQLDYCDD